MLEYIVTTLKEDVTPEEIEEAKKHAIEQKGTVTKDFAIKDFKGFMVEFDNDAAVTLDAAPHVKHVQLSTEVHTQTTQ